MQPLLDAAFFALAACELLLFAGVYLLGAGYVRRGMRAAEAPPAPAPAVPAALLVPCTGDSPAMRLALATLLAQDYPGLHVVFAVSHQGDPAAAVISGLIRGNPRASLVTAGFATASCQKNHNLLAALAAVPEEAEILIFCDSTHQARPDLCARLAGPLARGRARLASGFHQVVPGDGGPAELAMAWTVLAVHMLQAAPFLSQPWGGAMAVTRKDFTDNRIAELWSDSVVDDFTLGPVFLKQGARCLPVAEACLDTHLGAYSFAVWQGWWFRQLQYLKFCIPPLWVATALGMVALAAPLVLAPLYVLAWLCGLAGAGMALAGAGHLAALCALMAAYRPLVPGRPGLFAFIRAGFTFLAGTALLYAKTWTTNVMTWREISYEVALGGKVKRVIRGDAAQAGGKAPGSAQSG
jgi:ceramide glucosyltransferase